MIYERYELGVQLYSFREDRKTDGINYATKGPGTSRNEN